MNLTLTHLIALALAATAARAQDADATTIISKMRREHFAKTADGRDIEAITLTNLHGLRATIITWGATLTGMHVPDRAGKLADVTLGFDEAQPWLGAHPFFGAIAGRYANRIAKGRFTLDGQPYTLATNNGSNHLHGGKAGFDKRVWSAEPVPGKAAVLFKYTSADGEEGYPGKLDVALTYTLTDSNELRLDYEATTDKPTVLNLTNHAYWNLAATDDVLAHELRLNASRFTEVDEESIPTGKLPPVAGTAMDFTKAKPVGRDLAALAATPGGGYDHNYVIDAAKPGELTLASRLRDPASGRVMEVHTTEPGVQLYTGNYLKDVRGRAGRIYGKHAGLCLETQHFPDSPNHSDFPSTVLRPGEKFRSTTVHRFSIE